MSSALSQCAMKLYRRHADNSVLLILHLYTKWKCAVNSILNGKTLH